MAERKLNHRQYEFLSDAAERVAESKHGVFRAYGRGEHATAYALEDHGLLKRAASGGWGGSWWTITAEGLRALEDGPRG